MHPAIRRRGGYQPLKLANLVEHGRRQNRRGTVLVYDGLDSYLRYLRDAEAKGKEFAESVAMDAFVRLLRSAKDKGCDIALVRRPSARSRRGRQAWRRPQASMTTADPRPDAPGARRWPSMAGKTRRGTHGRGAEWKASATST